MNKELLKHLGFLDAEIDVYTALLRLGPSLVSKIHQETGHHRTHIYDLLEKLREKGLVSTFIQAGKKHFQAAPPNTILSYLEEKKAAVKTFLPELEKLTKLPKDDTSVELFKGKQGLKTVLQDILKRKKNYAVMGSVKQFEAILQFAMPQFLKQVEKKKIKERILCDKKEKIIKIKTGKYRYLKGDYLFPSSFVLYGNKVAMFIWQMPYFAIVINNKDIAQTYKNYFEFFWKIAKP
jgi:sugar-specific transcriptional regulator TrmB